MRSLHDLDGAHFYANQELKNILKGEYDTLEHPKPKKGVPVTTHEWLCGEEALAYYERIEDVLNFQTKASDVWAKILQQGIERYTDPYRHITAGNAECDGVGRSRR